MTPQAIIDTVRKKTADHCGIPEADVFTSGLCLYVTHFLCETLFEVSRATLLLQVGSAFWKFREHETTMTHVGYEWSDVDDFDDAVDRASSGGLMPEFHSWLVIREQSLVIDLCTPRFREIAGVLGHKVEIEIPDKVWCPVDKLPSTSRYNPSGKGCAFGFACLMREFGELPYFPDAKRFVEHFRKL